MGAERCGWRDHARLEWERLTRKDGAGATASPKSQYGVLAARAAGAGRGELLTGNIHSFH